MSKIVLLHDEAGNQERFDVSQVKARQLNKWKGWQCSVAVNSIRIDADGNVFSGTCRVGGKIGNIYDGWEPPTQDWVTCPFDLCACGTAIKVPKFKDGHDDAIVDHTEIGEIDGTKLVAVDHIGDLPIHVQWNLGRFCNYDCTYCGKGPKAIHNDTEAHKPLDVMLRTVDTLHNWANGKVLQFCFAGGEPTLNPDFLTMCQHIKELGHITHVTTNGSHGPRYWRNAIQYFDTTLISVHFEFTPINVLVKNIQVMLEYQNDHPHTGICINIMTKPTDWDKAMALIDQLRDLSPDFFKRVETQLTALRNVMGKDERLMEYTPAQIAQFGLIRE